MTARWFFSVDVEDPRDDLIGGNRYPPRVPLLTERYLDVLRRNGGRGTFFVVGKVARRHPGLIRSLVSEGHEIGLHSDVHVPLHRQDRRSFRDDLLRGLDSLEAAGAGRIRGYRAPCFSLTERTAWAYEVLRELSFGYSSSVLPARNPLNGWPGFGEAPRCVDGIVEIPVSLLPILRVPLGGLYFRVLPKAVIEKAIALRARGGASVLTYHHPYDADPDQPFPHPHFARWSIYGLLMRRGRGAMLRRLELAGKHGFRFERYDAYAAKLKRALSLEVGT